MVSHRQVREPGIRREAAEESGIPVRRAWYSLDDPYESTGFNRYGVLIDRYSGQITPLGQAFADYAGDHLDTP